MSRMEKFWIDSVKGFAKLYEGRFGSGFERYVWFQKHLPLPPKKILEIGCNSAEALKVFASTGYECTAIDYPEVIDRIKGTSSKINFIGMNIDTPNINEKILWHDYFDAVIIGEVIQHVIFDENLLYLCNKVLKPQGLLLLSTEQRKLHPDQTIRYYPKEILFRTLEVLGFDVKEYHMWGRSNSEDYIWVHAIKS